ncbi:MAG: T9SS type A sorting domain-containing protein [Lewinellaceae bacterium]|nr:T9SS type A sorting domain-containing protein [Lewinellaceae bacterium]
MRQLALLVCLLGLGMNLSAQSALNFWKPVAEQSIQLPENGVRTVEPVQYKTFRLDYTGMAASLRQAPMEFTEAANQQPLLIDLPLADGSFRTFRMWESPIMAPELTAKYPEIRNYAGVAADNSGTRVRLGVGYQGFHAFLFGEDGSSQSVRTYANGQNTNYIAYRLTDLPQENTPAGGAWCDADNQHIADETLENLLEQGSAVAQRGNALVELKTYRIAIAAKGEYAQFHGGTKPLVLAAINTALNYIVDKQERDFGVRMILIANNDEIIFLDPATDPYSGDVASDWMNQNPTAINSILGGSSYDLGHVFSRYVTGTTLGVVGGRTCNVVNKARGASSYSNTNSEKFFLVAAHEFGHQLDASHTWSNCPDFQVQLAQGTAFEPGSGTTIMSYAGACGGGGNNVQNMEDSYYHIGSIVQVKTFVWQGDGSACGAVVPTTNTEPEVSVISPKNVFIPAGTPFRLTASGTDPDGTPLTYCWEQYDTGPASTLGSPTGNAPMFRSFPPTSSPTRYFPRLQTVSTNTSSGTEVVPQYDRNLTFRVTLRDNHPASGGQDWEEIKLSVTTAAGPFLVSYPNANGVVWTQGEDRLMEWDIANTDKAPINCQLVNIKMSTDGGITFPLTLATNVPNKGRHCIRVPNVITSTVRIMVEAEDNVFFDMSNANLRIEAAQQPSFTLCAPAVFDTICLPAQNMSVLGTAALAGFSDPITLSAGTLPAGVTATFSPNPVTPGSDVLMVLNLPAGQQEGTFNVDITAEAGSTTKTFSKTVTVFLNDFAGLSLKTPVNGADGQNRAPALRWNASPNANTYEVELATNPSFASGTIIATQDGITADSFQVPLLLEKGAVYYWRFRPKNECGTGDWLGPFAFGTLVDVCAAFQAFDLPKNIPTSVSTIESKITVPVSAIISDVNIRKIQGTHQFFRDLEVRLVGPTGTEVLLFNQKCGGYNGGFNVGFDDSSPNTTFACPPSTSGAIFKPEQLLNAFNGQTSNGEGTLRVKDNMISSGGSLAAFELELCSSSSLNPPVLVNNNPLAIAPGVNAVVGTNLLKTEDSNNSDNELRYTLMSKPRHGMLQLYWTGEMQVGDQFTQVDLNNNGLRYFHYGTNAETDNFCFTVTDGEGGLIYDCFTVQPLPLSTREARSLDFLLTPNPATETARLAFGENLRSSTRVRLFDMAGRMVQTQALAAGQTTLLLHVVNLPKGVYTIAVDNAEGSGVQKLVVR